MEVPSISFIDHPPLSTIALDVNSSIKKISITLIIFCQGNLNSKPSSDSFYFYIVL